MKHRIWVFAVCRNEKDMLPFWLRHYSTFADTINVWDDKSDDGSTGILSACPKVKLADYPFAGGIDENALLEFAHKTKALAKGFADWAIWVDIDEFIWGLPEYLAANPDPPYDVLATQGYNMMHNGLPIDDGRQIWEIAPMGVHSPIYAKPVVFRPEADIRWVRGKHQLEGCNPRITPKPVLKLLHYRYLGAEYTRAKNAKNYARCGLLNGDKGPAWSCAPTYQGADKEGSPEWAEFAATVSFNVFTGRSPEPVWAFLHDSD